MKLTTLAGGLYHIVDKRERISPSCSLDKAWRRRPWAELLEKVQETGRILDHSMMDRRSHLTEKPDGGTEHQFSGRTVNVRFQGGTDGQKDQEKLSVQFSWSFATRTEVFDRR
ncbi:hypothetical protein SprV_0100226500 [Sparganum proliferum]